MYFDNQFTTSKESAAYYRKKYENDNRVTIAENNDGTITVTGKGNLKFF